jgi:hypothetical protein
MNWADKRLDVKQIKNHTWFFGADWNSLRYIEPPFVPRLNSITDTSYFPTDDLGNVSNQLDTVESVSAEKDLAFLGYVSSSFHLLPFLILLFPDLHSNGSRVALGLQAEAEVSNW